MGKQDYPTQGPGSWVVQQRHIQKNEVEKHLGVCDVVRMCKCAGLMPCIYNKPCSHCINCHIKWSGKTDNRSHLALTCGSCDQILRLFNHVNRYHTLRNAINCKSVMHYFLSKWISQLKQLSLNWNLNWLKVCSHQDKYLMQ